jgi:hypothetical protein
MYSLMYGLMSYSVLTFVGEGINLLSVYCGKGVKVVLLKKIVSFEPSCVGCAILIIYGDRAYMFAIISFGFCLLLD